MTTYALQDCPDWSDAEGEDAYSTWIESAMSGDPSIGRPEIVVLEPHGPALTAPPHAPLMRVPKRSAGIVSRGVPDGHARLAGWEAWRWVLRPAACATGSPIDLVSEAPASPPRPAPALRSVFEALRSRWEADTELSSSIEESCTHSDYFRIIGLGPDVIPLVLEAVAAHGYHWDWALSALTGEDVAAGAEDLEAARDAWLVWGRSRGFIA